jgi:cyclophilin family peptidyl-prolyl cis-trans isomerase
MQFARRIAIAMLVAVPLAAFAQAPAAAGSKCTAKDGKVNVKLTTTAGPITLALDKAKAPITVDNFVKYVEAGFYNGTIFHRVIDGFMIQGGGFTRDMQEKPTQAPIQNEGTNGLTNDAYTIAMARRPDPNSATAQFFINVKDNLSLNASGGNPGYAVFGKVTDGKETVEKIKKAATGSKGGHQNVPNDAVVIEKAECLS